MMTLLPKIALIICLLVFVVIIVRVLFFYPIADVKRFSELPLEDDDEDGVEEADRGGDDELK